MIKANKIKPAFAAIQQIFISARWKIGAKENYQSFYDLMDDAEYLAGLACQDEDKTEIFESNLKMLSEKHACDHAWRLFNEK